MEARKIIFAAVGALILLLTVLLYLKATGEHTSGASEDELAKAKREYERSQIASPRTPSRIATPRRASTNATPSASPPVRTETFSEPSNHPQKPTLAAVPSPNADMVRSREPAQDGEPSWQQQLRSVNKLYDRKNYEEARTSALELLEKDPENRRMLRVVVSSSCIMAEPEVAKTYYDKLPERDQTTMRKRCERYGVDDL